MFSCSISISYRVAQWPWNITGLWKIHRCTEICQIVSNCRLKLYTMFIDLVCWTRKRCAMFNHKGVSQLMTPFPLSSAHPHIHPQSVKIICGNFNGMGCAFSRYKSIFLVGKTKPALHNEKHFRHFPKAWLCMASMSFATISEPNLHSIAKCVKSVTLSILFIVLSCLDHSTMRAGYHL